MCHSARHIVTEISFNDYKVEILKLRQTVWEQTDHLLMTQVFVNGFYDEHDDNAFHWGVFNDDKKLIASARLSKHFSIDTLPDHHLIVDISGIAIQLPIASLNRLSVDRQYQGQGLSKLLDRERIEKACRIHCKSICGMTYGQRGLKLVQDGFHVSPLLTLSKNFNTNKENAKQLPPCFYYKLL